MSWPPAVVSRHRGTGVLEMLALYQLPFVISVGVKRLHDLIEAVDAFPENPCRFLGRQ
jgi:hypothetical protein